MEKQTFLTVEERRAKMSAAIARLTADISKAQELRKKGFSYVAVSKRMGIKESSLRALLARGQA